MRINSPVVIAAARRSILGAVNGSLEGFSAADLSIPVVESLLKELEGRSGCFSRDEIRCLIAGQGVSAGTGQSLTRQIAWGCGLKNTEAAFTVNALCGSGLESIIQGIQALLLDEYPVILAGGVETPSKAPFLVSREEAILWRERKIEELETLALKADMKDALWCNIYNVHTIVHAENTTSAWVKKQGLDPEKFKEAIDEWAVESNRRALEGIKSGFLAKEILPLPGTSEQDELPAPKKRERLSRRRGTHFTPEGIYLSNQNSPPPANCAAYAVIMKAEQARSWDLPALGRITAWSRSCVEPADYLLAPVLAVQQLFRETGSTAADYDLFELNTAFGSQMLINLKELNLDSRQVNITGDCLALGHPVGAAGCRLLTTLLYAMERLGKHRGLAAICQGGGNAIAMALEREV